MVDTQGKRYNPKLVNAVPATSTSFVVPEHLKESGLELRNESREFLWGWAQKIHAWLKEHGEASNLTITTRWKGLSKM